MKIKEILPNLIWVDFPNCELMARTLVRIQEHYESPKFRNKIFSFAQYKKWYRGQTPGNGFTYYKDIAGCNFPSSALTPFRSGCFNPLRDVELEFLNAISHLQGDFYMVATSDTEEAEALQHEIAHGLFYLNEDYRKKVTELINEYEQELDDVYYFLDMYGYNPAVFIDEAHAYVGVEDGLLEYENINFPMELRNKLQKLSKEYEVDYEFGTSH